MVDKSIITAKMANIKKNLDRLKENQGVDSTEFHTNKDIQDIVLLNLQAAIQGCIDVASHIISDNNWGVPGSLAGLFDILADKKAISEETKKIMRQMAGFWNLIVHEYAELDMDKVYSVFTSRLSDFNDFLKEISIYAKL
jgi:uncharacterized protein YutE (UPF0331/DUF86 family)